MQMHVLLPVLRACSGEGGEWHKDKAAKAPCPCSEGREEHPTHGGVWDIESSWAAG